MRCPDAFTTVRGRKNLGIGLFGRIINNAPDLLATQSGEMPFSTSSINTTPSGVSNITKNKAGKSGHAFAHYRQRELIPERPTSPQIIGEPLDEFSSMLCSLGSTTRSASKSKWSRFPFLNLAKRMASSWLLELRDLRMTCESNGTLMFGCSILSSVPSAEYSALDFLTSRIAILNSER